MRVVLHFVRSSRRRRASRAASCTCRRRATSRRPARAAASPERAQKQKLRRKALFQRRRHPKIIYGTNTCSLQQRQKKVIYGTNKKTRDLDAHSNHAGHACNDKAKLYKVILASIYDNLPCAVPSAWAAPFLRTNARRYFLHTIFEL